MVRTITLNDGKKIPALGWGNGTGGQNSSNQKAIDTGKAALEAGILHIDTAQNYRTETETNGAIQAAGMKRADVWVTTKISGTSNTKTDPDDIRRSVKESLDKLTFIPDLILIHSPFISDETKLGEFWGYLEDLVEDGTLKGCSLGVSNFRVQDLQAVLKVCKIKPTVNQLEYHPYVLSHLEPVLKLQDEHKIVTESYGPLTPILRHPTGGPFKPILHKIADRLNKSNPSSIPIDSTSVLLLWTINKGVVAVTSSGNPKNMEKMAAIEKLPDLTKEDIEEIDEAGKKIHYRHYGHMNKDFPSPDLPGDHEDSSVKSPE